MESSSLGLPRTPDRATSEGPSPPPRNSMEDADSSVTRKRPRLDSGDRAYRSMSADRLLPSHPGSDPGELLPAQDGQGQSYENESFLHVTSSTHQLHGTPSKVTINVRDPVAQTSAPQPTASGMELPQNTTSDNAQPNSPTQTFHDVPSTPPQVVTVSSSPMRSPEIEVAELEDIDGHNGPTVWRKSEESINYDELQASLLEEFPLADHCRTLGHALQQLSQYMTFNDLGDGHMLFDLAQWIEKYLHQTAEASLQWWYLFTEARDFWEKLPDVVNCLLRRNLRSDDTFARRPETDQGQDSPDCVQTVLSAYALLTARMIRIDCQTLAENAEDLGVTPDLVASRYITVFQTMLFGVKELPLWKMLYSTYNYDYGPTFQGIIHGFVCAPANGLDYLSQYTDSLLDRIPSQASIIAEIWPPIHAVNRLAMQCSTFHERQRAVGEVYQGESVIGTKAMAFFETINRKLQKFITKQVSSVSLDLSRGLVTELSSILRCVVSIDESIAERMLPLDTVAVREASRADRVTLIESAWRVGLFKKCIMQGRMEIRVQGIDTMQEDLVSIYQQHINHARSGPLHVCAEYLSNFILENKLVDYLVGVESHPQLIQRSKNIVGFLIVTQKYTEVESDVIWKTVSSTPDSRTIDAILEMFSGILALMAYPTLLYLCQKANELPLRYFDGRMISHCRLLLDWIRKKYSETIKPSYERLDMRPYDLCIRLIRQAPVEPSLPRNRSRELHQFALEELQRLMKLGPSPEDSKSIYDECVAEISNLLPSATGSIATINAFLDYSPEAEIKSLALSSAITPLIVNDFEHFAEAESSRHSFFYEYHEPLSVRLNLLQKIIIHLPNSITPELSQTLWNSMLGDKALGDEARNSAWAMLSRAMSGSHRKNLFLERCVSKHLPALEPSFLTSGVLIFAEKYILYETSVNNFEDDIDEESSASLGVELFWHLALTAPDSNIGAKAIESLVKLTLEDAHFLHTGNLEASDADAKVVERCIHQLIKASSKLKRMNDGTSSSEDDSMVIVASDKDVAIEKLNFARSLLILKDFMRGIRSRSPDSPASTGSYRSASSGKGERVLLKYQSYGEGSASGIHAIEVGDLVTFEDLLAHLKRLTGFTKFIFIAGGQKVDQDSCQNTTLRELKWHLKGLLLVKKAPDSEILREGPSTELRPLEIEVMKHFHELYDLLGIDEQLGKDVFEFLVTFPPHEDVTSTVCGTGTLTSTMFPLEAPYKTLYSVYALEEALSQRLRHVIRDYNLNEFCSDVTQGATSNALISHGVQSLVEALLNFPLSNTPSLSRTETMTLRSLVNCLLRFLKEPVSPEISATYFQDPPVLVDRLRQLIFVAQSMQQSAETIDLIRFCFSTILEASLHNNAVWECFKKEPSTPPLFQGLLLHIPYEKVREGVAHAMRGVCRVLPSPTETTSQDFVQFFWENMLALIPETVQHRHDTEQFFDIALDVFRSLDQDFHEGLPLETYLQDWSNLLLNYQHHEFVGRESVDWVVAGITGLLQWCIQLMKSRKRPLNVDGLLVERLFRALLFPEIPEADDDKRLTPRVPILHSQTRGRLYSILLQLSTDQSGYRRLLDLIKDLLPQGEDSHAWSWGIAQILEDYHYEANWNFERSKAIRSPTGYPGLKNLSNTCYLNSLFTQLFMNVGFRGFMLARNVPDGEASQKLLAETKRLFAYMQETWLKQVDPQGIVDSVVTYENSPIDVSIQMDVDEFYNLLFDRWESQITSANDKKTFRQFYGGQLVQQIKSKECPHISERLEPFSAIQCEIQGKASLVESMNAYVEGEVMEGDNKYSCSSCGSYVDAVKRSCLKDIPDNLIFHLKRFDYDLVTGQRSKINDHFEFPQEIDMSLYDVEYLKDPQQPSKPDHFQLVGVLVHSGNAESGHYYSYVRERPTANRDLRAWVEFNDSDVTRFDPSNIPDQCFGGLSEPTYSPMRFPKSWNAYMLFYERVSSMEREREHRLSMSTVLPAKEEVPVELANAVAFDNESWIRKYCLFDPEHAKFIKSLLEQYRELSKNICSENHELEKEVIWLALEHLDQVFSRAKDCPEFHPLLDMVTRIGARCVECCKLTLDWVAQHEHALRNLLLRSPDEEIRRRFVRTIVVALRYLRDNEPRLYGFDVDVIDIGSSIGPLPEVQGAFHDMVRRLKGLWSFMHLHYRAWDDYYGLLQELAQLGPPECYVLHREGYVSQCLELLVVDTNLQSTRKMRTEIPHLAHYVRLIEKGRKFSLRNVIGLLANLLSWADFSTDDTVHSDQHLRSIKFTITRQEEILMCFGPDALRSKGIAFLEKAISADCNITACATLIRILLNAEPYLDSMQATFRTIISGINVDPASLARPFLSAALAFCECCSTHGEAKEMLARVANEVETIGHTGGEDHLEFFCSATRLRNPRFRRQNNFFYRTVLHLVSKWAPTLLMYHDTSVREATVAQLHLLVFGFDIRSMDDEQQADDIERAGKTLCRACANRVDELIVIPQKQVDGRLVEQVSRVINHCMATYFAPEEDQDDKEFLGSAQRILDRLQSLTVSSPDDALSDAWENNSDPPTDSESELVYLSA